MQKGCYIIMDRALVGSHRRLLLLAQINTLKDFRIIAG